MNEKQPLLVKATYLWENGMVMTYDTHGNQVPELQGRDSPELREAIRQRCNADTKWSGFDKSPCVWQPIRSLTDSE